MQNQFKNYPIEENTNHKKTRHTRLFSDNIQNMLYIYVVRTK